MYIQHSDYKLSVWIQALAFSCASGEIPQTVNHPFDCRHSRLTQHFARLPLRLSPLRQYRFNLSSARSGQADLAYSLGIGGNRLYPTRIQQSFEIATDRRSLQLKNRPELGGSARANFPGSGHEIDLRDGKAARFHRPVINRCDGASNQTHTHCQAAINHLVNRGNISFHTGYCCIYTNKSQMAIFPAPYPPSKFKSCWPVARWGCSADCSRRVWNPSGLRSRRSVLKKFGAKFHSNASFKSRHVRCESNVCRCGVYIGKTGRVNCVQPNRSNGTQVEPFMPFCNNDAVF
jgi:hypothetical protein